METKSIEPAIFALESEENNTFVFLVAFADIGCELRYKICSSIDRELTQRSIGPLGEIFSEDLEYRFENNIWKGLTLSYTDKITGRIVSIVLINIGKIIRDAKSSPRYFLMNILSHEIRRLVDYIVIQRENSMTEVEEEPAYFTGNLFEHSIQFYEEYLQNMQ